MQLKQRAKWFGLGVLTMLLLNFVAFAWEEGDIINRATFSAQDFSSQDLSCRHEGNRLDVNKKVIVVSVSCLDAEIVNDVNVMVVRDYFHYRIQIFGEAKEGQIQTLQQCVGEGNTPRECWRDKFKPKLIEKVKNEARIIRIHLNELRDLSLPASVNLNDFTFTKEELNN